MTKEIKNKVHVIDYWNYEDNNQDVIINCSQGWRVGKKRLILEGYLESVQNKVSSYEINKDKKSRLRAFYAEVLRKTEPSSDRLLSNTDQEESIVIDNLAIEEDSSGNKYVSDDL